MSNTTKLPDAVYEMVQDLLDARSTLENVTISAPHVAGLDARVCHSAATDAIAAIDNALDVIGYTE